MQTKMKEIFEQLCGYLEIGMDLGFYTDEECEDIDALIKQFYKIEKEKNELWHFSQSR